ncbi:unnamed protein product [Prorocentrum cordatum]|uniref:RRM domain-containing protein n=1 Tax=Prorocentrum cordatum TaxID=2364126 RepID=A0ABN9XM47_9DINO|nr:unnamed protein product [Polarella glacialis]
MGPVTESTDSHGARGQDRSLMLRLPPGLSPPGSWAGPRAAGAPAPAAKTATSAWPHAAPPLPAAAAVLAEPPLHAARSGAAPRLCLRAALGAWGCPGAAAEGCGNPGGGLRGGPAASAGYALGQPAPPAPPEAAPPATSGLPPGSFHAPAPAGEPAACAGAPASGEGGAPPAQLAPEPSHRNLSGCLQAASGEDPSCLLVVRRLYKLGWQTERALLEHFSVHGPVSQVSVVRNRRQSRPGNLGFVVMGSPGSAKRALAAGGEQRVSGVLVCVQGFENGPGRRTAKRAEAESAGIA